MKKIKHIVAVLVKTAILFAPGVAVALWLRDTHGWPVSILAALGVEFIAGVLITFATTVAAQFKAQREIKKEQAKESAE